jgi:hypothetical protein
MGAGIYRDDYVTVPRLDALQQAMQTIELDRHEALYAAKAAQWEDEAAQRNAESEAARLHAIPVKKYRMARAGAKTRGIPFLLTFEEWWQIWQDSGHWEERGNLTGQYVMCRNADQGPYAVGNVRIDTVRGNWLEQLELAKAKHEAYENDT